MQGDFGNGEIGRQQKRLCAFHADLSEIVARGTIQRLFEASFEIELIEVKFICEKIQRDGIRIILFHVSFHVPDDFIGGLYGQRFFRMNVVEFRVSQNGNKKLVEEIDHFVFPQN